MRIFFLIYIIPILTQILALIYNLIFFNYNPSYSLPFLFIPLLSSHQIYFIMSLLMTNVHFLFCTPLLKIFNPLSSFNDSYFFHLQITLISLLNTSILLNLLIMQSLIYLSSNKSTCNHFTLALFPLNHFNLNSLPYVSRPSLPCPPPTCIHHMTTRT